MTSTCKNSFHLESTLPTGLDNISQLYDHSHGISNRDHVVEIFSSKPSPGPGIYDSIQLHSEAESCTIFVDSSPSWGIGFVKDNMWLSWKLKEGWTAVGRDNNWAEMVAVDLGVRAVVAAGHCPSELTVRSDNIGVVSSLNTGNSKHQPQKRVIDDVLEFSRQNGVAIKPKWISTKQNPADDPSRGIFPSRDLLFPNVPPLPALLVDCLEAPVGA